MTTIRYVLRDLPGMSEIDALVQTIKAHPNPLWAPEIDQLPVALDRVSRRLFGITKSETDFDDDDAYDDLPADEWNEKSAAWDEHFDFAEYYDEDLGSEAEQEAAELAIWESMGWDVTDGAGNKSAHFEYFYRQIICAAKGLKGRLPDGEMTEAESALSAERWARDLLGTKR